MQAFGTLFTNRIEADYDSLPNAILYRNIDGLGWNRGINADVWVNGVRGWKSSLGVTWLRSELFESGALSNAGEPVEFAPNWTTNMKVGRTGVHWGWNITAQTVGRMAIPYYNEIWTDISDPYALVHASVNRSIVTPNGGRHTLTAGIQNVTDATQPSPLLGWTIRSGTILTLRASTDPSKEDGCLWNGVGVWKAVRVRLSNAVAPKVAEAQFGLGHRMFVDDATGNEPKHHDPSQALQQEEHEACEADGLEPLGCAVHGTKVRVRPGVKAGTLGTWRRSQPGLR